MDLKVPVFLGRGASVDCARRKFCLRIGLLKAGRGAPRGLVLFRVVKVRRARLRERREGAKPNGLMAAVLAIFLLKGVFEMGLVMLEFGGELADINF